MHGWAKRLNLRTVHAPRACRVPQGAKTRVRVFADIQNFALRGHAWALRGYAWALRARHSLGCHFPPWGRGAAYPLGIVG